MLFQSIIDGLLLGGVYATMGLGLSLTFGVLDLINLANGELMAMAMFLAYYLVTLLGMDPYMTIIVTVIFMAIIGWIMQKFIFNKMIDKDVRRFPINSLLFTVGMAMVVSNGLNVLFTGLARGASTVYTGKSIILSDVFISVPKLISFALAVIFTLLLQFYLDRTEMGRALRATSQDRTTAQLMGIDVKKIFCVALAISFAFFGMASSLLIPYYTLTPFIGASFGLKAFMVVVIGGRGDIRGAFFSGLLIGVIEKVAGVYCNDSIAKIIIFLLFVFVLLVRPNGLLHSIKGPSFSKRIVEKVKTI